MAGRRTVLVAGALGAVGVALSGCGFALRRRPALKFQSVRLTGFLSHSSLENQLRLAIEGTGTRVVESLPEAEVVLRSLTELREQVAVVSTTAGQVREVTLRLQFRFRLTRARDDAALIPDTELIVSRDMTYNETDALAKQQEAELLFRTMQTDLVDQVMRRLAAVAL